MGLHAAVSRVVPCGPPEGELVQPALELEFHVLEYVSELVKEVGVAPEVLEVLKTPAVDKMRLAKEIQESLTGISATPILT